MDDPTTYGAMPFGLRDIKLTPYAGGTQVDLPSAATLKFTERLVTGEQKGDDRVKAVHSFPEAVDWEMEHGGISLEAYALMTGRTAVESGSTPYRTKTMKGSSDDNFPYFKIYGKSMDPSSGDIHCKLFKCKLTKAPEGTFKGGEFFSSAIAGTAIEDGANGLFEFVENETAAELPAS